MLVLEHLIFGTLGAFSLLAGMLFALYTLLACSIMVVGVFGSRFTLQERFYFASLMSLMIIWGGFLTYWSCGLGWHWLTY